LANFQHLRNLHHEKVFRISGFIGGCDFVLHCPFWWIGLRVFVAYWRFVKKWAFLACFQVKT